MAKGAYYPIYQTMYLYRDTFSAADYGNVGLYPVSTVSPNTGSDKDTYNAIYDGEKGNCYVNTTFGWGYSPTVNLWWVRETYSGGGWEIGWTNDSKNAGVSVPTLSTSSTDIGNSITINFNRQSPSFAHTVDYWLVGTGYTNLISKTSATSYTWNTNNYKSTLLSALPSSTSGNFQIRVSTYNGSTLIGTKYKDLKLKVPTSIKPSITSISGVEANNILKDLELNHYVRTISKIKVSATGAKAGQGSTIASYVWTLGDAKKEGVSPVFEPIDKATLTFKLTIKDARGRSATLTGTSIKQKAYAKPSVEKFKVKRYNSGNPVKINYDLTASYTAFTGATAGNRNLLQYKIDYKVTTANSWTSGRGWTSYLDVPIIASTLPDMATNVEYTVRLTLKDTVNSQTTTTRILKGLSKKWLEVINGETINVIGTLQNNGVPVAAGQSGTAEISTQANIIVSQTINFPKPFASVPTVVISPAGSNPAVYNAYSTQNITKTGFDVFVRTTDARTAYIRWIALETN